MTLSKKCPRCKKDKLFREFYPEKASIDGRQEECKECTKTLQKNRSKGHRHLNHQASFEYAKKKIDFINGKPIK